MVCITIGLFVIVLIGSFFLSQNLCLFPFRVPETERKMKKIDNSTMGGRIKEHRLKMGMTQEELAEKMFTTKMTISHYENDLSDIKGSVIVELADLLGTTTGYLLNNEVDAKTSSWGMWEMMKLFQSLISIQMKNTALEQLKVLVKFQGNCKL